jgi:hypothetical protein
MKKISLREFVDAYQEIDRINRIDYTSINWNTRLQQAGYHFIHLNLKYVRQDIISWCEKNYGTNFAWTGNDTFWFNTEKDAVLFALRWA